MPRPQLILTTRAGLLAFALCVACGETSEPDSSFDAGGVIGAPGQGATTNGAGATTVDASNGSAGSFGDASGHPDTGTPATPDAGSSNVPMGRDAGVAVGPSDSAVNQPDAGTSSAGPDSSTDGPDSGSTVSACKVSPITDAMRDTYPNMNNPYYEKFASAKGIVVATGSKVADEPILRYCRLLTEMFSNEKVRQAAISDKMWFTMISEDEQLSSLPQISKMYGTSLNARARGLGGLTPTICAEDSIMCMPGDPWVGDCICPHETGHTLYSSGIARVPDLSRRLTQITNDARSSGRLANAYVWMDGNESGMMAWGVQAWYDCAINGTKGSYHSDINTRAELQKELPDFYQFLSELLPTDNQYDDCYAR